MSGDALLYVVNALLEKTAPTRPSLIALVTAVSVSCLSNAEPFVVVVGRCSSVSALSRYVPGSSQWHKTVRKHKVLGGTKNSSWHKVVGGVNCSMNRHYKGGERHIYTVDRRAGGPTNVILEV